MLLGLVKTNESGVIVTNYLGRYMSLRWPQIVVK